MKRFILSILFCLAIFVGSCQTPQIKAPDIPTTITSVIKDKAEDVNVGRWVLLGETSTYVGPLLFGTFIGTVLTLSGVRKIGIAILLASISCLVLLYALTLYTTLVGIIGLVVLLAGLIFFAKNLYDRAIVERDLVQSVQVSREYLLETNDKSLKDRLDILQSKATKEIVKKIKSINN